MIHNRQAIQWRCSFRGGISENRVGSEAARFERDATPAPGDLKLRTGDNVGYIELGDKSILSRGVCSLNGVDDWEICGTDQARNVDIACGIDCQSHSRVGLEAAEISRENKSAAVRRPLRDERIPIAANKALSRVDGRKVKRRGVTAHINVSGAIQRDTRAAVRVGPTKKG